LHSSTWTSPVWHYFSQIISISNGIKLWRVFL
jgi:hypothetical protein